MNILHSIQHLIAYLGTAIILLSMPTGGVLNSAADFQSQDNRLAPGYTVGGSTSPKPLFGVVRDTGDHLDDLWARGARAVTFELQWKRYEPQEGLYDQAYINHMRDILSALKQQGWFVQLVPGFHYTPEWVFQNYPHMYFENQYGERYDPDPVAYHDFRVTNAPFNPQARALIAGYLKRIFQDFDQNDPSQQFDSVRIGGGVQGELRYPPPYWNGHENSFWAFDAHAQNPSESGIPSQVVGWRPGVDPNPGAQGRGQAIINPGFEESHPRFEIFAWASDEQVQAAYSGLDPHSGSKALKLTLSDSGRIHQYLPVEPNTTYQLGGWLRSSAGGGLARLFSSQYDLHHQPTGAPQFIKLEADRALWTSVSGSLTTSGQTHFLKIELDGDRPGNYFFDDLWLREDGAGNSLDRDMDIPLAFYTWYVDAMSAYQNWQIAEVRKHFQGQLDLVLAGKGLRARQLTDALTNGLAGTSLNEESSALYSAAIYPWHLQALESGPRTTLYLTGIEQPSANQVDDASPYPGDWSAARWMAYLGQRHRLLVWGENSGGNTPQEMALAFQRMHANGFTGLLWAFESEMFSSGSGYANSSDYQGLVERYAKLGRIFLPLTIKKD
jgi:hypothetical protein